MNKRQLVVVWVTTATIAVSLAFPPWEETRKLGDSGLVTTPKGYRFFAAPPQGRVYATISVDGSRLVIACMIVTIVGSVAFVTAGRFGSRGHTEPVTIDGLNTRRGSRNAHDEAPRQSTSRITVFSGWALLMVATGLLVFDQAWLAKPIESPPGYLSAEEVAEEFGMSIGEVVASGYGQGTLHKTRESTRLFIRVAILLASLSGLCAAAMKWNRSTFGSPIQLIAAVFLILASLVLPIAVR